ncbi:hypothetical protein PG995_010401 [Apiospora arundinis]
MTEMQWTRDIVSYPDWFTLPPGFEALGHLLPGDFVEAIEDVHALQHMRDSPSFICQGTVAMFHVDNHQAWAQSKLQRLTMQHQEQGALELEEVLECCYYAVYLSSTMLCYLIRDEYVTLLKRRFPAGRGPWEDLSRVLRQFIWSERAFAHSVKAFYDELLRS